MRDKCTWMVRGGCHLLLLLLLLLETGIGGNLWGTWSRSLIRLWVVCGFTELLLEAKQRD